MELTQLFGVTVEQLLGGEIPDARLEGEGDPVRNIGSFVNGVINDIGNLFKSEPEDAPEPVDGAMDAQVVGEDGAPEAAAASPEADGSDGIDLAKLAQMAPFMSKAAVEDMLRRCQRRLTASEIARFAPFVDSAFLESLIADSGAEISWDTLRRVAPFLKREAVDAFARAIALGEKTVRPAADGAKNAAANVYKSLDDVLAEDRPRRGQGGAQGRPPRRKRGRRSLPGVRRALRRSGKRPGPPRAPAAQRL